MTEQNNSNNKNEFTVIKDNIYGKFYMCTPMKDDKTGELTGYFMEYEIKPHDEYVDLEEFQEDNVTYIGAATFTEDVNLDELKTI